MAAASVDPLTSGTTARQIYLKMWYQKNRDDKLAKNRAWKEQNRERYREQQRAYRHRPERIEASRLAMQDWRAANPERDQETRRKAEAARDPEKRRDKQQRYKARLRGAPVVEKVDRLAIYKRDSGTCHICKGRCSREAFTLDHLVPLIHNGEHTSRNLAVAHFSCNSRRGPGRIPAQLLLIGE